MVKNKPEIRFKGFEDVWEEKKVKDITTTLSLSYSGVNRPKQEDYKQEGDYMYVPTGEINFNNINSTKTYLNKDFVSKYNYKIIPEGVLLMAKNASPTAGKVAITNKESIIINTTFIFQMKELIIYQKFLYHFFTNNYKHITSLAEGSTQKDLKTGTVLNYKINFPSLPEQERIGNFLSRIDSRIDSLKKEKIGLENYKKALLQKMFPKKGENKPEIRFKVFTDDWEEVRVGDIIKEITRGGDAPNSKNKKYWGGEYSFLALSDIKNKYLDKTRLSINQLGFNNSNLKQIEKGNILFSVNGSPGKVTINKIPIVISALAIAFKNKEDCSLDYIYNMLIKESPNIIILAGGSTIKNLKPSDFKNYKIKLPSLPEQKRIGNFLSNLDSKINSDKTGIEKEIGLLEDYKKGLLQKMLI